MPFHGSIAGFLKTVPEILRNGVKDNEGARVQRTCVSLFLLDTTNHSCLVKELQQVRNDLYVKAHDVTRLSSDLVTTRGSINVRSEQASSKAYLTTFKT